MVHTTAAVIIPTIKSPIKPKVVPVSGIHNGEQRATAEPNPIEINTPILAFLLDSVGSPSGPVMASRLLVSSRFSLLINARLTPPVQMHK